MAIKKKQPAIEPEARNTADNLDKRNGKDSVMRFYTTLPAIVNDKPFLESVIFFLVYVRIVPFLNLGIFF